MNPSYSTNGFVISRKLFAESELKAVSVVINHFHLTWIENNKAFYKERAVNSAYLTAKEYLDDEQRAVLFQLIGSKKIMALINSLLTNKPCFMNAQLFFDPYNSSQKNYWHRDPQYHLNLAEQQAALTGPQVIHIRIPLKDERGIEIIPASHKNWDSDEALKVRLETDGRKNSDDLAAGLAIELNAGDVLAFSANAIHRGLYGQDRLSLDLLFCDFDPSMSQFIKDDCLPDKAIIKQLQDPSALLNTIELKANN